MACIFERHGPARSACRRHAPLVRLARSDSTVSQAIRPDVSHGATETSTGAIAAYG